jgi:hypothetical protein
MKNYGAMGLIHILKWIKIFALGLCQTDDQTDEVVVDLLTAPLHWSMRVAPLSSVAPMRC